MLMHVVHEVTFSNTTIVMTFSPSLRYLIFAYSCTCVVSAASLYVTVFTLFYLLVYCRFRKGVTNFPKICLCSIQSSGMTCVGTELVKDAAKI
jgi:hypothetical protein